MNKIENSVEEKQRKVVNGWLMVAVVVFVLVLAATCFALTGALEIDFLAIFGVLLVITFMILIRGFKVLSPNEAAVYLLFGKYYGTVRTAGFYWLNPFVVSFNPANTRRRKISLKANTLDNEKQKVNDLDGNPIEIGVMVTWQIKDTAKAVFNVENYEIFISSQTDAAIRNIARQYPYDTGNGNDEKTLRGSSQEISKMLQEDLDNRVEMAGIDILEARISHLAYAQEIASSMLQRQQAKAVVDARTTIVEGAVGMVQMALDKLSEENIVELDTSQKAQMVSNLMVVLCSNKDAQPVINNGSNI